MQSKSFAKQESAMTTSDALTSSTRLTPATQEWMTQQGFNPNDPSHIGRHDDTPLIAACRQGVEEVVLDLLRLPADVIVLNHRNMDGTNALWATVVANHFLLADNLLAAGIDINNINDHGASTLMYAASSGKTDWVSYLLDMGADTRAESLDGFTALDLASNIECLRLLRKASKTASSSPDAISTTC